MARARLGATAIQFLLSVFLVAGCIFPDRGTAIANDIRDAEHPLIETIAYGGDDDGSGPQIAIWLRPETTREQTRTIACDVVKPAVERGSPPEGFGYVVLDEFGETLATEQTPCP